MTSTAAPLSIDCSIVIPAWNAAGFVTDAIKSALAQSGLTLEVLVVDDASTDGTAAVVRAVQDDRLRLLQRDRNGGAAAARNDAFAAARGRWIAVLDADDLMEADRLQQLVSAGDRMGSDLVADNLWCDDGIARTLHIAETLDGKEEEIRLEDLYREALMFAGGRDYGYLKPLFRRDFLVAHDLRYDTGLAVGEDFQLVAECLARGGRYHRLRQAGYIYSRRPGSLSHRLDVGRLEAIAAADRDFINRFAEHLTPVERKTIATRLASVDTAAAFTRAVDALKRRAFADAWSEVMHRPSALLLFRIPITDRIARMMRGR